MLGNVVYAKTAKGEEALRHRDGTLPADARMVLLVVNGMRNVETLKFISEPCRESLAPLIFLEDNGFIEQVGSRENVFNLRQDSDPDFRERESLNQGSNTAVARLATPPMAAIPQTVSMAPAPLRAVAPQYAADRVEPERVRALIMHLQKVMGSDSAQAVVRAGQVQTREEFVALVGKLGNILREYKGVREAEHFLKLFERG